MVVCWGYTGDIEGEWKLLFRLGRVQGLRFWGLGFRG